MPGPAPSLPPLLSKFEIDFVPVAHDDKVNLPTGTTRVRVSVLPANPNDVVSSTWGSFEHYGTGAEWSDSEVKDLLPGLNRLEFTVTPETSDPVIYGVDVVVDSKFTTLKIAGFDYSASRSVNVPYGTTSVPIEVVLLSGGWSYLIDGNADFIQSGRNLVTITFVDPVGNANHSYIAKVDVDPALSNDSAITYLGIFGDGVSNGATIQLSNNEHTEVKPEDVIIYGLASGASYIYYIDQAENITLNQASGSTTVRNTFNLIVTAPNGINSTSYYVYIDISADTQPTSNVTTFSLFTIADTSVNDGDSINVAYGTSSVVVNFATTDSNATFVVSGDTVLAPGANSVTVTVTAQDQITIATYTVTVTVLLNDDTSLTTFQINGVDVVDGGSINVTYATSVTVTSSTTDPDADVETTGHTTLVLGPNEVTVTVTAANGTTQDTYTVTVNVKNNDADLTTLLVAGMSGFSQVIINDITLPYGNEYLPYFLEKSDSNATVVRTFNSVVQAPSDTSPILLDLERQGPNVFEISVTSEDVTTTKTFTINVTIAPQPDSNKDFTSLKVCGQDITTDPQNASLYTPATLPFGNEYVNFALTLSSNAIGACFYRDEALTVLHKHDSGAYQGKLISSSDLADLGREPHRLVLKVVAQDGSHQHIDVPIHVAE